LPHNFRYVMVLSGAGRATVEAMFIKQGWLLTKDIEKADLVQFTGGADVSPYLYGEFKHPSTGNDPARDVYEQEIYDKCIAMGVPMAGICRGGQFLNVMNGGSMYQDVDGHAIQGTHKAFILGGLLSVDVSSTHHQMMRPNLSPEAEAQVIMSAALSKTKENMTSNASGTPKVITEICDPSRHKSDVEAVYYGATNCLCFQPHPEFPGPLYEETRDVYFNFLNTYVFSEDGVVE
jgi:gamma-glutamyl-gamma-aminobutyrate hydrolase PuuD